MIDDDTVLAQGADALPLGSEDTAMTRTRILASTTLVLFLAANRAVSAQVTDSTRAPRLQRWEVLSSSGAILPTGAQRSAMKRATLSTAQVL